MSSVTILSVDFGLMLVPVRASASLNTKTLSAQPLLGGSRAQIEGEGLWRQLHQADSVHVHKMVTSWLHWLRAQHQCPKTQLSSSCFPDTLALQPPRPPQGPPFSDQ